MARRLTAPALLLFEPGAAAAHPAEREAAAGAEAAPSPAAPRRRIWEVDAKMHCSVLGTCLTLGDLYASARRARCAIGPAASAYEPEGGGAG